MDLQILREIGLTDSQIRVYLSLLKLGISKSGLIIKETSLSGSVVYRALEDLIEMGLVSFVIKSKTKFFSATSPKNILRLWDDKKDKLKMLLPELESIKKQDFTPKTRMFVGWKGVQTAFNTVFDVLPEGSEYIAFAAGSAKEAPETTRIFFKNYQRKRIEMKYDVKLIINKQDEETFEKRFQDVKKWKIRYVDDFAPRGINVFGDNVLIVSFEEVIPLAVIISSKAMANNFRNVFYNMWKIAKK